MCDNCMTWDEAEELLGMDTRAVSAMVQSQLVGRGRYMSCQANRKSVELFQRTIETIKERHGVDISQARDMGGLVRLLERGRP